jgi:hypothetical protein
MNILIDGRSGRAVVFKTDSVPRKKKKTRDRSETKPAGSVKP